MFTVIELALQNVEFIRAVQDGSVDDITFKDGRRVADVALALFSNVGVILSEDPGVELPQEIVAALKEPSITSMIFERIPHEEGRIESDLMAVSQLEKPGFSWDNQDEREYSMWMLLSEHVMYSHTLKVALTFSQLESDPRFVAATQWFDRRNAFLRAHADVFKDAIDRYSGWCVPKTFDADREWWFLTIR